MDVKRNERQQKKNEREEKTGTENKCQEMKGFQRKGNERNLKEIKKGKKRERKWNAVK